MTWQYIDENTYIDDTLVTCAEYQLFIDEMREQGKYYQPDHWASYQFPAEAAREPILGVRHSDAVAFCEWLAQRESDEWNYRLPSPAEAEDFSIIVLGKDKLGYWIDEELYFAWINPNVKRVSEIDAIYDDVLALDIDRHLNMVDIRVYNKQFFELLGFDYAIALDRKPNDEVDRKLLLTKVIDTSFSMWNYLYKNGMFDGIHFSDIFRRFSNLHERIAGRSRAFEGIRLVKERIK